MTSSTPPTPIRWSGLESEEMKRFNSSLLFPSDAVFEPLVVEIQRATKEPGLDPPPNFPIKFQNWGAIQFTFDSARNSQMPGVCTIAGVCHYTDHDKEQFRLHVLSKKERRQLGRTTELSHFDNWPDARAFEMCPVCAKSQDSSENPECLLIFYPIWQLAGTGAGNLSAPMAASRTINRLMCGPCLTKVLGHKRPAMVSGYNLAVPPNQPILRTLSTGMPALAIFQRNGLILNSPSEGIGAWNMYRRFWFDTGLFQTVEAMAQKQANTLRYIKKHQQRPMSRVYGKQAALRPANKKKKCLTCLSVHRPSYQICSRCKWAIYCSKECQKADWKRHKLVDCKPVGPPDTK